MRITEQDKDLFKTLSNSGVGESLTDFFTRLISDVCDSRNWTKDDTRESTQKVATVIQKEFIDRIKKQNKTKNFNPNDFE